MIRKTCLIGDRRFVEKFLETVQRLVNRAADDVQLGQRSEARLQIDVDLHLRRCRGHRADHAQVAQRRAQSLAVHVDLGLLAVNLEDDTFEPQRADSHAYPRLDRCVRLAVRGRLRRRRTLLQAADDLLDGGSGIRASGAGLARADRRGGAPGRLIRITPSCALSNLR